MNNRKIILGVDPGTVIMGFALLDVHPGGIRMLQMDSLRLDSKVDMFDRLSLIHQTIQKVIQKYSPHELSIEAPFFGKNVQSMLKLGRAQGVVIATALEKGLPVAEYSPRRIKQAITGNGNATKERVWTMLQHTLGIGGELSSIDASDALAVAVCHHYTQSSPIPPSHTSKKGRGWEAFLRQHPERIASRQ